jgi:RHH-type proline utilization regulon transcriptional repressor/proline dehydrogenase/delta 1-pyrroline-5-carboxylate dehydrogenase
MTAGTSSAPSATVADALASEFVNEPVLELRRATVRDGLAQALADLDARLPVRAPVWIGDERREGDDLESTDPGAPDRVVSLAAAATPGEVDAALSLAVRGAGAWSATPASERAAAVRRAAARLRERRPEITALEVRECAKPWPEADADVCEAIDHLEYNARAALALERGLPLVQVPGERNTMRYAARGVCAVIAPWNFPVAIPAAMTSAALATGNAVVLKPAEQSPGCGAALVEALRASGVPSAVLALLPGDGAVGAALVRDPRVDVIAFTGSVPVGLDILRAAAETPGRHGLKRVVAELGGKNCVLVDADADLDEVVPGVIESAFLYAGQKCSAASRVLVHRRVADLLIGRLAGALDALVVGQASDLATEVPPVIARAARDRVAEYRAAAQREGRVILGSQGVPAEGWFAPPALAIDLPAGSRVLAEEIFGPLLAVERVRDMEDALARVDASPYALTGGLYARNPETVREVVRRSPVGNLYVNRPITGAKVGRQPFGGGRLSGTGAKAGGPDYLLSFVEPRVLTENTVRHGMPFAEGGAAGE